MEKGCIVPAENAMDALLVRLIATLVLINSNAWFEKKSPLIGQPADLIVRHLRQAVDFGTVISSFICQYYDS